ncbi:hypothetical protein IU486_15945 [Streptomyces gardneri]|uniref:hypothetical protein n=1 Tax=Nocardia TaxID=1817 RepID=UPI0013599A73|nr:MULTISPECIES: hypothetical protein [Nocardia]MBF6166242.1 hypothetical protein [Streptomyces gardneri]
MPVQLWPGRSRRSRFESIVDDLELPPDWTVEPFFARLEQVRGREIVHLPLPEYFPVELCGLWLARSVDDVVLYRPWQVPTMARHVVAHEGAHMLLGHGRDSTPAELAALLAVVDFDGCPDADASTARKARGASSYSDRDEYEAELLSLSPAATSHRRECS